MRPRAILSRLLVVLVLALFSVPQSHADGSVAQGGPAAQSQVEQAHGIVPAQRHLLRAQISDDNLQDVVPPDAASVQWQSLFAVTASPASELSLLPLAIRILPPVRGPPAA